MNENYKVLVETRQVIVQNKLYQLLTSEKEFMLDIFKDYWNNDSNLSQKEWVIDYLIQECLLTPDLSVFMYSKHKTNIYLQTEVKK